MACARSSFISGAISLRSSFEMPSALPFGSFAIVLATRSAETSSGMSSCSLMAKSPVTSLRSACGGAGNNFSLRSFVFPSFDDFSGSSLDRHSGGIWT